MGLSRFEREVLNNVIIRTVALSGSMDFVRERQNVYIGKRHNFVHTQKIALLDLG